MSAHFLVQELQKIGQGRNIMAYVGKEEHFPIWLPESLPEEIAAENFFELLSAEAADDDTPHPEEPNFGFIVQDWFGPFLLSPPTRFLRGQC